MLLADSFGTTRRLLDRSVTWGVWPARTPAGTTTSLAVFVVALVGATGWRLAAVDDDRPLIGVAVDGLLWLLFLAGALLSVGGAGTGTAALGWQPLRHVRRFGVDGVLGPVAVILAGHLAVVAVVGGAPGTGTLAAAGAGPGGAGAAASGAGAAGVVLGVLAVTLAPLAEETLFRGLLLGGQLRRYAASRRLLPTSAMVAVNGLVFALVHGLGGGLSALLQRSVLGVGCGVLAVRDRSLLRPVLVHALVNLAVGAAQWT